MRLHFLWRLGEVGEREMSFPMASAHLHSQSLSDFLGHPFFQSLFLSRKIPQKTNSFLPFRLPSHSKPPKLHSISQTQSSDPDPQAKSQSTVPKPSQLRKNSIWVNPNRAKSSNVQLNRYAHLCKLSESLNSLDPMQENSIYEILSTLGENPDEREAVMLLNGIENWKVALLSLRYFQERIKPKREVVLYNVTLKALRKAREWEEADKLLNEMVSKGINFDNITFSTIISFARLCSLHHKAVEWFEKMDQLGCVPDIVTYSAMIDAYWRAGFVDKAMALYDQSRREKWRLDTVTFSTIIKMYGMTGNFDGALNVYEEMKALGIKCNLVIYNTLLDAMGRAGRPWQMKNIYKEMNDSGFVPSAITYSALIRGYSRARYAEDALLAYREMREKGFPMDVVLYNCVLSMCADLGCADEAIEIFKELENSEDCKPDSWTFSSLITIYSCSGQVSEAENMLNKMVGAGFEPNIFVLTSLVQCYGKAKRTNDVVMTFNKVLEMGLSPDDRLCSCLLSVMSQTPKKELDVLMDCLERANTKLSSVVKLIVRDELEQGILKQEVGDLFYNLGEETRKAYCNCLIDLCVNLDLLDRACELLELGLSLEIYTGIQSKSPTQWSLHVRSLSLGAALTALHAWMNDLSRALESGEEFPPLLGIHTGHGKHKYNDSGLATVFESHLREINAPFHEAPDRAGWFLTTKVAATSWLESRNSPEPVVA
ncbi:hypothetical protein AMTR_s00047p00074820 [Amborella trichopoda]|uniref:Smr domain-containing protein n=2 Tax=Amborella trichopoda TaxID=13333 RepID=U5CWL6_AMBTC|nr:hypothetical protein AMTR_s00047p00074820 [Amborella trichopoda]